MWWENWKGIAQIYLTGDDEESIDKSRGEVYLPEGTLLYFPQLNRQLDLASLYVIVDCSVSEASWLLIVEEK
jgi:hypothetical protein